VPEQDLPFVSVVVATTMAREAELQRCLAALLRLDYAHYEVVLVDNRPSRSPERMRLYEGLCRDSRVRIVQEARPGISPARNTGARAARGEIIAFTDDDVVVHPTWLRAVGSRFVVEPATGCVTGPVLPAELETPTQVWFERSGSKLANRYSTTTFRGPAKRTGLRRGAFEVEITVPGEARRREFVYRAGTFGMGANIAMRRSAFAELGGFCEALGTGTSAAGGEDIEALARLLHRGGQLTYDPAAIVWHRHRGDLESARAQMHGYGRGLTAAITALVLADPRHLVGLARMVTTASKVFADRSTRRGADGYPRELASRERSGLLAGPVAYLWGRFRRPRRARLTRWSPPDDPGPVRSPTPVSRGTA
jgi:GT2 family glycosyltransferase